MRLRRLHVRTWPRVRRDQHDEEAPAQVGAPVFGSHAARALPCNFQGLPCAFRRGSGAFSLELPHQLEPRAFVDALAAGNCILLKPSHSASVTDKVLAEMCDELFPARYITCIHGSHVNDWLLEVNVDKMFFTGSQNVGREIMGVCAQNLTDVTLELGGMSHVSSIASPISHRS